LQGAQDGGPRRRSNRVWEKCSVCLHIGFERRGRQTRLPTRRTLGPRQLEKKPAQEREKAVIADDERVEGRLKSKYDQNRDPRRRKSGQSARQPGRTFPMHPYEVGTENPA